MNVQHSIHIPSFLKVYDNALDDLGSILQNQGINRVVLYFGNDLIEMFGSKVMNSLKDAQVDVLEYKEIDTIALNDITQMAFSISPKAQAVIGIGGGKVIDAAKYMGFLKKLPFISIPTSTSSDGFASSSIFCTNNLRQCVTGFTEYLCSKDTESLRRGIYFGKVLICFYGGAAIAFLSCKLLDLKGSWIAILPTVAAFVMCNAEYVLYDVKKKDILKASA